MELLIGLISGVVGSNVAGGVFKKLNLSVLGNSIAGIEGGGVVMAIFGVLKNAMAK